jgi:hypothetical protein
MLAIDVRGPLNDIRAAQFAKEVFVAWRHAEGGEDAFISRVPRAKSSNSKTKNITRLVLSFKVGFEMHILKLFTGNSFFQSFLAILERTAHIFNGHMVVVLNDNIGAIRRATILNGLVGGNGTLADSVGEAVYNLIVPGGDSRHVDGAVTEDMGERFILFTVAAGRIGIGPTVLDGVDRRAVKSSSMDESPVLKTNVEASEVPV